MAVLLKDLQYAVRQLRRSPGFAVTAVLTLALGIGATTAIFNLIYNTLLKPLPVEKPGQLYMVGDRPSCCNYGGMQTQWNIFSNDLYLYFRDHTRGFENVAAFGAGPSALLTRRVGDPGAPETLRGRFVSGNEFATLGVPMALGRPIQPSDDTAGAAPVVVLSYRAWEHHYGRNPAMIGAQLSMNHTVATVVGVTAAAYQGEILQSDPPELWLPLNQEEKFIGQAAAHTHRPDRHWLDIVGRIAPGATPEQIQAQLNVELRQWLRTQKSLTEAERNVIDRQSTVLSSARTGVNSVARDYGRSLKLLMGAAGFVLLIVCANVANLLLVRAMAERQQQAVRIALGATRAQLVRQALLSSLLLALAGSLGAVAIAYAVAHSVLGLAFRGSRYVPVTVAPSLPVLAFAAGVALLTAVVFGIVPAWIATGIDPASVIRGGGSRTTKDGSSTPQRALVILQAALSVVLLCAAGLLLRSLNNLQKQDLGLKTENRYIVGMDPFLAGYKPEQTDDLYRKLSDRLMQIPGARHVGIALYTPMAHNTWNGGVFIAGQPDPQPSNGNWYVPSYTLVSPNYFDAVGTKLKSGRVFTDGDNGNSRKVAVVNQAFANRYFHGDAVGKHFGVDRELRAQFEIVGVVESTKYADPDQPATPMYFLPFTQTTDMAKPEDRAGETLAHYAGQVVIEVNGSTSASVEPALRRAFAEVNPNLTLQNFTTFAEQVSTNFNENELLARLTTLFGLVALILASVGIYGVTAYSVERRTAEIGVRMALGADRGRILRDVLRSALMQSGIGLLLGIPLAYAVGRLLTQHLYGVGAFNGTVSAVTLVTLFCAAALAALLPARRAASIEPMTALRTE